MEIISFVQDRPHARKFNFWLFERKSKEKKSSITFSTYNTELKSFGAEKVKPKISPKNIFIEIGRKISVVESFFAENLKKLLLILSIFVTITVLCIGIFAFISFKNNYTGTIKLPSEHSLDIEALNKLMSDFAMEGKVDYDESGNLLDAIKTNTIYTKPVSYQTYKVQKGDTISGITKKFGLSNISTLISVNDIGNVRQLASGQKLKIPSIDGIIYTIKKGDSLDSIVKNYNVKLETLIDVNELESEILISGEQLFIPGVAMDSKSLKEAMGELFIMPIKAKFRWTSPYGSRIDPIAGVKSFHTGTDMACPTGTPIYASMSGTISTTGVNRVYGNYVIIDHGNGYQTLYAHMSKIIAKKGQWVSQGTRIGLVGSTGYSTGPHLHFTVYKNGKMINPMTVLNK